MVATQIGVINVNAPRLLPGPEGGEPPPGPPPLNLTIGISEKGYTIAATGGVLPGQAPDGEAGSGPTIPTSSGGPCDGAGVAPEQRCGDGGVCPGQCGDGNVCRDHTCVVWDHAALYNRMVEIKEAYPDENGVNVGADDTIRYGTIAAALDAVRLRLEQDRYTEPSLFAAAEPRRSGEGQPVTLFSDVVMAVVQ